MLIDFVVRRRVVEVPARLLVPKLGVERNFQRRGVRQPSGCYVGVTERRCNFGAIEEDLVLY